MQPLIVSGLQIPIVSAGSPGAGSGSQVSRSCLRVATWPA